MYHVLMSGGPCAGNHKYLEIGENAVRKLQRLARTRCGFGAVVDVTSGMLLPPPGALDSLDFLSDKAMAPTTAIAHQDLRSSSNTPLPPQCPGPPPRGNDRHSGWFTEGGGGGTPLVPNSRCGQLTAVGVLGLGLCLGTSRRHAIGGLHVSPTTSVKSPGRICRP